MEGQSGRQSSSKDLLKDGRSSNMGKGTMPVVGLEAAPGRR